MDVRIFQQLNLRTAGVGKHLNSDYLWIHLCVFVHSSPQDSDYVVAERNFVTDDHSMLSFHKGDIIRLQVMDGLDKGNALWHTLGICSENVI